MGKRKKHKPNWWKKALRNPEREYQHILINTRRYKGIKGLKAYLKEIHEISIKKITKYGESPKIWKKITSQFNDQGNPLIISFPLKFEKYVQNDNVYIATQIAAITYHALKCKDPYQMFQIGFTLRNLVESEDKPYIEKESRTRLAAIHGSKKLGKTEWYVREIHAACKRFAIKNPKFTYKDIILEFDNHPPKGLHVELAGSEQFTLILIKPKSSEVLKKTITYSNFSMIVSRWRHSKNNRS